MCRQFALYVHPYYKIVCFLFYICALCIYFWNSKCYHKYFYVNCVVTRSATEIYAVPQGPQPAHEPSGCSSFQCGQTHTYIYIHIYNCLLYITCDRYSVCISVKSDFVKTRTTKSTVQICINNMLHKITQKHLANCTLIFETELFPSVMVQKRQHLDVLGCHIAFSGLIFDSVQI